MYTHIYIYMPITYIYIYIYYKCYKLNVLQVEPPDKSGLRVPVACHPEWHHRHPKPALSE